MKPHASPISCNTYYATELSVVANRKYDPEKPSDLTLDDLHVESSMAPLGSNRRWMLVLTVEQDVSSVKNAPYNFTLLLIGQFEIAKGVPEKHAERLLIMNGSSLLYAAAREILRDMTSKGPYPPLLLPTLSFFPLPKEETIAEKTKGRRKIVLNFGMNNTLPLYVDRELTVGKLLSYRQLQELLGYDYHNIVAKIDGVAVDFETLVGRIDTEFIDLEVRQNIKAALPPKALVRKLSRLGDLTFKRRGAKHNIYVNPDGVQIYIPRHARDIATGTLRKIAKNIRPGVGLSDFKKRLSE
jgi:Preprotein translocase subunit SecB